MLCVCSGEGGILRGCHLHYTCAHIPGKQLKMLGEWEEEGCVCGWSFTAQTVCCSLPESTALECMRQKIRAGHVISHVTDTVLTSK